MRVLRLLIYEGPDEWVQDTLDKSHIKGTSILGDNDKKITEIILGKLPDSLELFIKDHDKKKEEHESTRTSR